MSGHALSAALKLEGLSLAQKSLCLVLASYADHRAECWPSRNLMGRGSGLSTSGVTRTLKQLEDRQLIRRTRQTKAHGGSAPSRIALLFASSPSA